MFMWVWRGFIFSLSIALFAAISSPVSALDNSTQTHSNTANLIANLHYGFGDISSAEAFNNDTSLTQTLLSSDVLHNNKNNDSSTPNKTPAYKIKFNPYRSLPAYERQAVSAFGSVSQNEPVFVLAYEFQPEILGLKYFLAPLITDNVMPWYLRPDTTDNHGRVAGWKDTNTLYTGTITYLS